MGGGSYALASRRGSTLSYGASLSLFPLSPPPPPLISSRIVLFFFSLSRFDILFVFVFFYYCFFYLLYIYMLCVCVCFFLFYILLFFTVLFPHIIRALSLSFYILFLICCNSIIFAYLSGARTCLRVRKYTRAHAHTHTHVHT